MLNLDCGPEDRRRQARFRLDERTRLRPNDWSTLQVDLVDISSHGFRATCEANLRIGGYVTLDVQGIGQVDARIVWRRGERVGAHFAVPISLDHCAWVREPIAPPEPRLSPIDVHLAEMLARRAARLAGGPVAETPHSPA
jgi:hypothetical protein